MVSNIIMQMLPYVAAGTFCGNETLAGALRNYTDQIWTSYAVLALAMLAV